MVGGAPYAAILAIHIGVHVELAGGRAVVQAVGLHVETAVVLERSNRLGAGHALPVGGVDAVGDDGTDAEGVGRVGGAEDEVGHGVLLRYVGHSAGADAVCVAHAETDLVALAAGMVAAEVDEFVVVTRE